MTVHRTHPSTRRMRETPDIDQLKRQARELLEAYRAQSPDAVVEVAAHHRLHGKLAVDPGLRGSVQPDAQRLVPDVALEADTSPGKVNPGSVDIAIL